MFRALGIFIRHCCKNLLVSKSSSLNSNKKVPRKSGLLYFHQPHYFLPPLTLAIMKMINAIKPTTRKMPQTIPALKIPLTTEQLPRQKAKKQISEEINNLILFFLFFYQIAYLFFILTKSDESLSNVVANWGMCSTISQPFTISPPLGRSTCPVI
jgi:hypothetical protein